MLKSDLCSRYNFTVSQYCPRMEDAIEPDMKSKDILSQCLRNEKLEPIEEHWPSRLLTNKRAQQTKFRRGEIKRSSNSTPLRNRTLGLLPKFLHQFLHHACISYKARHGYLRVLRPLPKTCNRGWGAPSKISKDGLSGYLL